MRRVMTAAFGGAPARAEDNTPAPQPPLGRCLRPRRRIGHEDPHRAQGQGDEVVRHGKLEASGIDLCRHAVVDVSLRVLDAARHQVRSNFGFGDPECLIDLCPVLGSPALLDTELRGSRPYRPLRLRPLRSGWRGRSIWHDVDLRHGQKLQPAWRGQVNETHTACFEQLDSRGDLLPVDDFRPSARELQRRSSGPNLISTGAVVRCAFGAASAVGVARSTIETVHARHAKASCCHQLAGADN